MNSEKVETWDGIIISPAQHVQKSREGHGKNWMHFVYKLDNLFQSIIVSDENSSVTPAIQNFSNLLQLQKRKKLYKKITQNKQKKINKAEKKKTI